MFARQPHAIVIGTAAKLPRHSSWMLSRLTMETKVHHLGVDEGMIAPLVAPTVHTYRHFLARMYGFAAPVGIALLATPGLDATLLATRMRTGRLASDLLGIGLTRSDSTMLQNRVDVPVFSSGAEALGWLYVTERLTLRHQLICNRLCAAIPEAFGLACAYLTSTRGRARQQWTELGVALDRAAHSEKVAGRIVAGAHAAFAVQRRWIDATVYDGF